jgi:hypothetical protein
MKRGTATAIVTRRRGHVQAETRSSRAKYPIEGLSGCGSPAFSPLTPSLAFDLSPGVIRPLLLSDRMHAKSG